MTPRISSPYGWRTRNGKREFHSGEDYAAACATPMAAAIDGRVRVRKLTSSYGWHVWIDGARGLSCLVAHLSEIYVADGERVRRGQLIAASGGDPSNPRSGRSTGCHTHYEERINGEYRRPVFGARIWEVEFVLTKKDEATIKRLIEQGGEATYRRIVRSLTTGWVPAVLSAKARQQYAAWLKRLPWIK